VQGCTIYLAGAETTHLLKTLLENRVRFILLSYYYIRQFNQQEFVARMQARHPDVLWFLDSGAFTYSTQVALQAERLNGGHRVGKVLPSPERYVEEYFDYIDQYGDAWCRITEPDLDGFEGLDVTEGDVDAWREEMLDRWPHLNVTPCYHGWRGREAWTAYCEDPRIKTLSFGRKSGDKNELRLLCLQARRHGKPVHGFGFTRVNTSLKGGYVPVDSADSTSWVLGQKYGLSYVFRANQLITLKADEKDKRGLYANYYRAIGVNADAIIYDDAATKDEQHLALQKANIIAWRNLAARFHAQKEVRDHLDARRLEGTYTVQERDVHDLLRSALPRARERDEATAPAPRALEREEAAPKSGGQRILAAFNVPVADPTRERAKRLPPKERDDG
jgi:hypothetical protein